MTLDMAFMLLCDKGNLRFVNRMKSRAKAVEAVDVATLSTTDGMIKGRDVDGKPIQAKIVGQSLASRIRARKAEEARLAKEKEDANKKSSKRKGRR